MQDWRVVHGHLAGAGDIWFADSSKNREGAGAGVYGKNGDTSLVVPLGPHSTVLETEIAAMRMRSTESWPQQEHPHLLR